jgi:O-antigen/teichoic acid export membrane protein
VLLAVCNAPIAVLSLAWPLLSLSGQERVPLYGLLVALVALVVAAELAVPRFGMMGAAVSRCAVLLGFFGGLAFEARRRVGVSVWPGVRSPSRGAGP